jgi:hypothetical protein
MRTAAAFTPHRRLVAAATGAVALVALTGACAGSTETQQTGQKYGAVNFVAKRTVTGKGAAAVTFVAFEGADVQVPNSSAQQNDQCVYANVDTTTVTVRGDRSAGDAINIVVAGIARSLPYSASDQRYATAAGAPILYTAGDVAQVSVPGNGNSFPAMSGSVKLAEPIELGPLATPTSGANLTVTWNGTNDATAAVILQIKYPNPVNSSYANEQVYCALKDDGSVNIPAGLLNPFLVASSKRSLTLLRWRTNLVSASGANLHFTASTDTTVVFP